MRTSTITPSSAHEKTAEWPYHSVQSVLHETFSCWKKGCQFQSGRKCTEIQGRMSKEKQFVKVPYLGENWK